MSALTVLATVINESNPNTVKKIANLEEFVTQFKNNFGVIIEHMKNYPDLVPNIIYALGSNNEDLGDWIIDKFLMDGQGERQASIINQIITSSEEKISLRMGIFLKHILAKIAKITKDDDVESGIMYV